MSLPIFNYIVARNFFPAYASAVVNWKSKVRGLNGRGNVCEFTKADIKLIRLGIMQMHKDLNAFCIINFGGIEGLVKHPNRFQKSMEGIDIPALCKDNKVLHPDLKNPKGIK